MKEISELVLQVFAKRIPKIEILQEPRGNHTTKFYRFYKGIKDGVIKSDEDGMNFVYKEGADNDSYRKLKSRFRERLLTTILFVEPRVRGSKSYFQNVYFCYKHLVVAKLLLTIGIAGPAYKLLRNVLKKSEELELFDLVEQCSLALRRQAMQQGNLEIFKEYNTMYNVANKKLYAENRMEELYYEIAIHYATNLANKPGLAKAAKNYMEEGEKLRESFPTYNMHVNYFNLKVAYLELDSNFNEAIRVAEEYEKYLLDLKMFYSQTRHANILLIKLNCCLQVRNAELGIPCAEKALGFYAEGNPNWFTLLQLYFLLTLNSGKLDKAVELYIKAISHPRFENTRAMVQEEWKIYGGYLWFLLQYHQEKNLIQALSSINLQFKINKLVNDMPIYAKDKKGLHVAVLILQILFLIQNGEYVEILKRTEALYNYTYRNLNKDDAIRSHYFIKMLLAMEKSQFEFKATVKRSKVLVTKLQNETVEYTATQSRIEIIPYEELWNLILEMIQRKRSVAA